jgi:hypothetical protein
VTSQGEIIDQFVEANLTAKDPIKLYQQKALLIVIVVAAAIIAILATTSIVILLTILAEKVLHNCRAARRRERYELIPTYHNVRALRKVERQTPLERYPSYESIDPPPPPIQELLPTAPPAERTASISKAKRPPSFAR